MLPPEKGTEAGSVASTCSPFPELTPWALRGDKESPRLCAPQIPGKDCVPGTALAPRSTPNGAQPPQALTAH